MKEIIIKIMGVLNGEPVKVTIMDLNNNIITNCVTYNGKVCVRLEKNKAYRIIIRYHSQLVNKVFIVRTNNVYSFILNGAIYNPCNRIQNITFLLNDYFYNNLPIERGVLTLNG